MWAHDWWQTGRRSLSVFPDVAAMAGDLPDALVQATAAALTRPDVEELDI